MPAVLSSQQGFIKKVLKIYTAAQKFGISKIWMFILLIDAVSIWSKIQKKTFLWNIIAI